MTFLFLAPLFLGRSLWPPSCLPFLAPIDFLADFIALPTAFRVFVRSPNLDLLPSQVHLDFDHPFRNVKLHIYRAVTLKVSAAFATLGAAWCRPLSQPL